MASTVHVKIRYPKAGGTLLLPFVAACTFSGGSGMARAQAIYTATRPASQISIFAAGSRLSPDYGRQVNYGYTLGAEYMHRYRFLNPAVMFRLSHAGGDTVGQTTYTAGLAGGRDYGRFHPYGDVLLGYGKISFTHPSGQYFGDDSTVFGAGAGADVDVIGNFAAKVDFQYQSWKLGSANHRLTPTIFSLGVVYHLPLKF